MNKYQSSYIKFLSKFLFPERPLKVVVDCSNGAVGPIAQKVFKNNSFLNFKFINQKPDGDFPVHGPDPLKGNAFKNLRSLVLKQRADLGVVFDADGDRAFFVDNYGRKINPDAIARLLIWHLKPKKVVIDARTGWLITKFQIITSKVGRYFVQKLMKEKKADFGVEHSGHYYFKKFYFFDSGILAAVQVMNAVSKLPYSLADFVELLPIYYSKEIDLKIKEKKDYSATLKKIQNLYKKSAKRTSYLDGLKMEIISLKGNWWFNIHFSNTESVIRLTIESDSERILAVESKKLVKLLK